jgi:virulence RhuM family protein
MKTPYPIEIFQSEDGQIRLEVQLKEETVWLTQKQIGRLFERERSVITKHINNIFKEGELVRNSVCANFAHTAEDGKTYQTRYFSLDVIISVGYRVKSQRGVQFRQWATQTLKQHLIQGYTINRGRLVQLGADVDQLLGLMQKTLAQKTIAQPEGAAIANLIQDYARTWQLLLAYDERKLDEPDGKPYEPVLDTDTVREAIGQLKARLLQNGQATAVRAGARPGPGRHPGQSSSDL